MPEGEYAEHMMESGSMSLFKTGEEFMAHFKCQNGEQIAVGDAIVLNDRSFGTG